MSTRLFGSDVAFHAGLHLKFTEMVHGLIWSKASLNRTSDREKTWL